MRTLEQLFVYDDWANREALASLERARSAPASAVQRMAHTVSTELLWFGRLTANLSAIPVWPDWDMSECRRNLGLLLPMWRDYLATHPVGARQEPVSYVNSKGQLWSSAPEDVLLHVVMHGAYHRGQIASDLRAAGEEPAYTDFIHAARNGFV